MKNNILRRLMTIACLLFCLQSFGKIDYDFKVDGLCYNIESSTNHTVSVTYNDYYDKYRDYGYDRYYNYFKQYTGAVVIPEKVVYDSITYSVTSIGPNAFYGCTLTSITIPNSITTIAYAAFYGCNIKKAIWLTNTPPNGYTELSSEINYVANNQYTSLKNVTIYPYLSSMFELGGIKYVPVSPSERTCDAIDCAYDSTAVNININNTVSFKGVDMTVKEIKPYTFYNNNHIKEVNIDFNGIIPVYAFYNCSAVSDVTINTQTIEDFAFSRCDSLKNANIKATIVRRRAFAQSFSESPATISIDSEYIENYAFQECTSVLDAIINAREIMAYAFVDCSNIVSLTVNANSINSNAFSNCATTQNAIFNIKATKIGNYCFNDCSKVEAITLNDDLTSIGKNAFAGCSNLKEIVIPNSVTALGEAVFKGCSSLKNVVIGNGVTMIKTSTFSGCSSLSRISIPKNITSIDNSVFNNCSSLANVSIEDRDTELLLGSNGSNPLFYSCPLDSVYIGGNISYPTSSGEGYSPFYRNIKLRSVVIADKETEISENEFYGCTNLKNISMGDGVEKIGNWAFSGCSSLEYFAFGSGMKTIGEEAFSDCTAMAKLISKTTTPPTCGTQALDDINKWTCELIVPQSTVSAYQGAEQWKEFFFIQESSGVESTFATDDVAVSVENGNIVITGTDNTKVEVYSVNGQCVYNGNATTIPVTTKGMYIVKVNNKSFKVII